MVSFAEQLLKGQCADAAKALSSKNDKSEVLEDLGGLAPKNIQRISRVMTEKVGGALQHLSAADDGEQDENVPDKTIIAEAETLIKEAAIVLKGFVGVYDADISEEIEQLILDLCGEAVLGFPTRESMQDTVARLGLEYLCSSAPSRLGVSVQLVPHLLWKILHGDVKAADAKRLNQAAAAGAFQILDFDQPESTDTVEMILRVSMHPMMLNNAEGEILFKAWQTCSEENREHIEKDCIQDLMNSAILARTTQLHANIERVLSCLHEQKSTHDVQEMLDRLYKPILWPALAAPNANVRRNAISVLLSAFPITDGRTEKEALEETVTMQVTRITTALRDSDPTVRKQVATGACVLLSKWWDLVADGGAQLIGKLMVLLKMSAFDSESPKTRVAVLEGLALLVQNPQAQSAVAITLKDLNRSLYDSNKSVRKAMVELIQQVANIKTLKCWEIFDAAELVSIMGSDSKEVSEIIHNMLFTQFVEGDDLNLQACSGLMQMLRDRPSSGVAFCRTLAERAASGENENITVASVSAFAVELADYLASCTISSAPAKSKARDGTADDVDKEGNSGSKRPREEGGEYCEWETLSGWTSIVCGLKELILPVYRHCRQKIDLVEDPAEKAPVKKKGGRAGKAKKRVIGKDATAAENLLQETLPAEMLVALLDSAPTAHAVQEVLSIGKATPLSPAAIALADHCLGQIRRGCIELPNLRKKSGGKVHKITFSEIPRQGHLPAEPCKQASMLCEMMYLLVKCSSGKMLNVLCDGLGTQPDLPQAARGSKRTRKHAGKKNTKSQAAADDTSLDGYVQTHGALALLGMLFRSGVDVHSISTEGLPDLVSVLGEATAQWTEKLSGGETGSRSVLNDALLTSNCFCSASAVAASKAVIVPADVIDACHVHVERVRECVLKNVHEESEEPIDVDDVCAELFASLSGADEQTGKKAKRPRNLNREWHTTNQQGTMLYILGNCTLGLAGGAHMAIDRYQELQEAAEYPDSGVTETDVAEAEATAMRACMDAWASGKALVERHTVFVMDHISDSAMKPILWSCTAECLPAVSSSLGAVLRGLSAARLPGDFPELMLLVGLHLVIAQTMCSWGITGSKLSVGLVELSNVVLNGCSILVPGSSDAQDQHKATDGVIRSPLQGLGTEQQQQYILQLLHGTFGILGLLRMQAANDDEDSVLDVTVGADWLFSGIATLKTNMQSNFLLSALVVNLSSHQAVFMQVAYQVRSVLRQHMRANLDRTEADSDENVRRASMGCKILLASLGDG